MNRQQNTIFPHPESGADTNSGAEDSPLRTLAEAARRVNQTSGTGPMTIVLSEGIYAVGETTLLKPERRLVHEANQMSLLMNISGRLRGKKPHESNFIQCANALKGKIKCQERA